MEKQLIERKTCTSSTTSDTNLTLSSLGQKLGYHDRRLVTIQLIMYNLLLLNNLLFFLSRTKYFCLMWFLINIYHQRIFLWNYLPGNKGKWHHKQTPTVGPSDNVWYKMNKFYPVSIHKCHLSVLYEQLKAPKRPSNDTPTQNCSSKRTTVMPYAMKLTHIYQVKQGPDSRIFLIRVQKPTEQNLKFYVMPCWPVTYG